MMLHRAIYRNDNHRGKRQEDSSHQVEEEMTFELVKCQEDSVYVLMLWDKISEHDCLVEVLFTLQMSMLSRYIVQFN